MLGILRDAFSVSIVYNAKSYMIIFVYLFACQSGRPIGGIETENSYDKCVRIETVVEVNWLNQLAYSGAKGCRHTNHPRCNPFFVTFTNKPSLR